MKDSSTRITIDFIINLIIAGTTLLAGIGMTIWGVYASVEIFLKAKEMLSDDLTLILLGFIIIPGAICLICFILSLGIVPLYIGVTTFSITLIARMKYTVGGKYITNGYKTLNMILYIINGSVLAAMAIIAATTITDLLRNI
ncbi:MAG: hypothetical protein K6A79_02615 [Ruminococcus sp.]|nr:hypothetical protein [Ruminococcus sp.]